MYGKDSTHLHKISFRQPCTFDLTKVSSEPGFQDFQDPHESHRLNGMADRENWAFKKI